MGDSRYHPDQSDWEATLDQLSRDGILPPSKPKDKATERTRECGQQTEHLLKVLGITAEAIANEP